jgi:tetratricopeptide (TPR) repeat protein/transcriptional regulator with XRE-family HTH domain
MVLRQYRLAAGLTQQDLAERGGVSLRTIVYLEHDRRDTPRPDTLTLLAGALGLSPQEQAAFLAAAHGQDTAPDLPPGSMPAALGPPLHPLIGRQEVMAHLETRLQGNGPPLLLLTGEPGIGKTRLLREVARRAVAAGWTTLSGGCHRHSGQEPYAPLLEALQHHLVIQAPLGLRRHLEGCAWLVQLLPELADGPIPPLPVHAFPADQQRRLMVAAVQRYLANSAGPAGTLLLLDDLQWAGRDALDLLAILLRAAGHPQGASLRVVGAYRDTEVDARHPLAWLLADLAPAGLVEQEDLGPLSPQEAAQLLAALLPDGDGPGQDVYQRIARRTGGVPFFVVSYAHAVRRAKGEREWDALPWDLRQSIQQRVAALRKEARDLLGVTAVTGREAEVALLLDVAGIPEDEVAPALDEASRARLLVERGREGYQFVHDLIQEVVEADLGPVRRAVLHRKVAEALERQGERAPAERVGYHYLLSDAPDKALPFLEPAGDQAERQHAYDAAEVQYRALLDRLDRLGRVEDAARVRMKLGEVLNWTGRYDAALQVLEPAAETYRAAGNLEGLGRVAVTIAAAHARRGAVHQGIAQLQPLLEELERGGASAAVAALYRWRGVYLSTAGRYDESLAALERAVELAGAGGDDRTLVQAAWHRADTLQLLGRLEEALRAGQEVLPLAEALGDLASLVTVHRNLAYTHALRGAFGTSRRHGDGALALADRLENPPNRAFTLALRGWIVTLAGDWPDAQAALDQALALSRQLDRSWYSPYILLFRARLSLAEGDWAVAAAALEDAIALAEGSGDLQALRWAATTLAEVEILEGRPKAASARLTPLLDRSGLEDCDVTTLLPVLAWAQLELGQVEQAAATVAQALARARPEEMRLVLVEALRVQALIALRRGQGDEAARSLEEGLALARAMPYPYAEARLLRLDAEVRARLGEPAAARERLEAARAIFARLGARRDAEQVEQAVASLPQHPAPFQNPPSARHRPRRFGDTQLTEVQWAAIAPLLPRPARTGRPRIDDRRVVEAILYKQETDCAWSALPPELGDGVTAHRRLRAWQRAGVWAQIAAIVQAEPRAQPSP